MSQPQPHQQHRKPPTNTAPDSHVLPGHEDDGGESILSGQSREQQPADAADSSLPDGEPKNTPQASRQRGRDFPGEADV
ncbi:MAG: hypothetical protein KDA55_23720 [Planctomycetales bacterium]|nr:hypothetical protein [Planctomycetales bacterium]MCA9211396.1 hypothetical protein [Planctomycetales bacterium]